MKTTAALLAAAVASAASARADTTLLATRPGLMCTSPAALATLTAPGGGTRVGTPAERPGDRALMQFGGCVAIRPGMAVSASAVRRQTSIVAFDPGDGGGVRNFVVPNADFASATPSAPAASPARACLAGAPAVSHLAGVIHNATGYGPPGFGEDPATDPKFTYAALALDHRICVAGGSSDEFGDHSPIDNIELFLPDHGQVFDSAPWLGRRVVVTGTLETPASASQSATDVYIDVTGIRAAP